MRRRIHLHGSFAGFHDGPIEIDADTIWDAVEAVTRQVPGFAPDPRMGRKRIQVVGFPTIESLKSASDVIDIHIIPALTFGKNGGLIQTIVGVTLLVIAFFLLPISPFWATVVASAGLSMLVGGVIQMLSPQPQLGSDDASTKRSKYLSGGQNTVAIGTTIPLLYGRFRVGGQILSLNIDAKDTGL